MTDFPLFEGLDDEGVPIAAHHPFTMPHREDLDLLDSDPLAVRSEAYDLVLNGWELGSGSIRIHREDIQRKVFDVLGISPRTPRLGSAFCSVRCDTGLRHTAASRSGWTAWSLCSPGRRTSAR